MSSFIVSIIKLVEWLRIEGFCANTLRKGRLWSFAKPSCCWTSLESFPWRLREKLCSLLITLAEGWCLRVWSYSRRNWAHFRLSSLASSVAVTTDQTTSKWTIRNCLIRSFVWCIAHNVSWCCGLWELFTCPEARSDQRADFAKCYWCNFLFAIKLYYICNVTQCNTLIGQNASKQLYITCGDLPVWDEQQRLRNVEVMVGWELSLRDDNLCVHLSTRL